MDSKWMFPESPEEVAQLEALIASGRARLLDRTEPSWCGRTGGWLIQMVSTPAPQPKRLGWFTRFQSLVST